MCSTAQVISVTHYLLGLYLPAVYLYISLFIFWCTSDRDFGKSNLYILLPKHKLNTIMLISNNEFTVIWKNRSRYSEVASIHYWKKVTKVATPWPASDPAMTPRGEEAAARAK